jgi:hypothetical protein
MKHFDSGKSKLNRCRTWQFLLLALTLVGSLMITSVVLADGQICWTGQGVTDGVLNNIVCDGDTPPGNMLWILTTGGSTGNTVSAATLHLNGSDYAGVKKGTQFHFYTPYIDPANITSACATYVGTLGKGTPVLTISHGCPPANRNQTLWCSPGFWKNALDGAWLKTGYARTDSYNATSCGTSNPVPGTPSLQDVLNSPQTYGGAAFNCVGQLLTNTLCGGGHLNPNCPNADTSICPDACPLDHQGNIKSDAPAICQP